MANFIEDVVTKLGLKVGQKFCIRHYDGHLLNDIDTGAVRVFYFTENGLLQEPLLVSKKQKFDKENLGYWAKEYLQDLIVGRYTVAPYEEGCEKPKFDLELKDIYDTLEWATEELEFQSSSWWLETKKRFYDEDDKSPSNKYSQYAQLSTELGILRNHILNVMKSDIFKGVRK